MIRLGSRLEEFNVVEVLAFGVAANNVTWKDLFAITRVVKFKNVVSVRTQSVLLVGLELERMEGDLVTKPISFIGVKVQFRFCHS
jgi:hypothetical protein